jgi:dehydrogenase/reductase SDR family member 12
MKWLESIQDASVVRSFDRSGFLRHRRRYSQSDIAVSLEGKICLVTGSNSGIGKATAEGLARRGAEVWLLCRNRGRAEKAQMELKEETGNDNIHVQAVDMSSLASVKKACTELPMQSIDALVHNAGVLPGERRQTAEGLELTYATNVAGPFLMTTLLQPRMEKSKDCRLVWVASGGMLPVRLNCGEMADPPMPFNGVSAYAQTKRAQSVLTELLAEKYTGNTITVSCMHPGWVDTPAVETSIPRFHKLTKSILRRPAEGADTILWLVACRRLRGQSGFFWFDRRRSRAHVFPWTRENEGERRELLKRLLEDSTRTEGRPFH